MGGCDWRRISSGSAERFQSGSAGLNRDIENRIGVRKAATN
jgi:hypothetical protein